MNKKYEFTGGNGYVCADVIFDDSTPPEQEEEGDGN